MTIDTPENISSALPVVAEFRNVGKSYGDFQALKNLSLEIRRGEILGFLGPNGAGKSTSLKLLTGLRQPTSGEVLLFGEKPSSSVVRRRVGMTPQELDFPPQMKTREVLQFLALSYGRGEPHIWREKLQLEKLWDRRTQGLSGGEKRRLGLACALIAGPELLLLDEPTTGLDVEARRLLWDVVRDEQKRGVTICLTTHYLDEVEALSHRVIVIDQGQKLFEGSVKEIRRRVEMSKIDFEMPEAHAVDWAQIPHLSLELRDRNHCVLWSRDSDESVRALVQKGVAFRHLSVHPASLEEAFIQLRGNQGTSVRPAAKGRSE